jgi:hypothetical protein
MKNKRKEVTCEIEVPHTPSLHLPNEASLAVMLREYANRKVGHYRDYYTRFDSPKTKIGADIHEARIRRAYKDNPAEAAAEERRWRAHRDVFQAPALRLGDENSGSVLVSLSNVTHRYLRTVWCMGKAYGTVALLNTPRGRRYSHLLPKNIRLVPVIAGGRILKMAIKITRA